MNLLNSEETVTGVSAITSFTELAVTLVVAFLREPEEEIVIKTVLQNGLKIE